MVLDSILQGILQSLHHSSALSSSALSSSALSSREYLVRQASQLLWNARLPDCRPDLLVQVLEQLLAKQEPGTEDFADACVRYYQKQIEQQPDSPTLHWEFGNVWFELQQYANAISSYQTALELSPSYAEAYFKLGNVLIEVGQYEEAIAVYYAATALKQDYGKAFCNLGVALFQQGRYEEAAFSLLRAIELMPKLGQAYWNLHLVLDTIVGKSEQFTYDLWRQICDRYSDFCSGTDGIRAQIAGILARIQAGPSDADQQRRLTSLEKCIYEAATLSASEASVVYAAQFAIYNLRDDPAANARFASFIGNLYVEKVLKPKYGILQPRYCASYQEQNLRIGLLSPSFRRHSLGWTSGDMIRELARLTPHVYLYQTSKIIPDDRTQFFQHVGAAFHTFHSFTKDRFVEPSEAIAQIHQDNLDVLIDLDTITATIHADILYHHPAPICISWIGGSEALHISPANFFLTDVHIHPEGADDYYLEKLLRLPRTHMAVSGFDRFPCDRKELRANLGIPLDAIVFLCVAAGRKVTPEMVSAQVAILKRVPNSMLLHKGKSDTKAIGLLYQQACEVQAVNFTRIRFLTFEFPEEKHRTIYDAADVLLDSYPYNGCTHLLEALWFELPVVTHAGKQSFSRYGYLFLQHIGIHEGIGWAWDEYITWGIKLGLESDLRQSIRERLALAKQPDSLSPIWNPTQLACDLYEILVTLRKQVS